MTNATHLSSFYVRQRFAMMTNRYEIVAANADGGHGELLGLAEQKKMALREQVTFWSDESRSRQVFGFRARKVVDLGSGYDIVDEDGRPIGFFRKDFGASLLRSTFHLEGPGYVGRGQERSTLVAILRRFSDFDFLPIHFDYVDDAGRPLMSVERRATLRDSYTVTVPDPRVDFRVAASVAVAMDVLMGR